MARFTILNIFCVAAALTTTAADAGADEAFPLRAIDRPTTLPGGRILTDVGVAVEHEEEGAAVLSRTLLGFGFGLTDHLQVDAVLLDLEVHPDRSVGQPVLTAAVGWDPLKNIAILPRVGLAFPLRAEHDWAAFTSLNAAWTLSEHWEIAVQPAIETTLQSDAQMQGNLPFILFLQLTRRLFAEASAGVALSSEVAPAMTAAAAAGFSIGESAGVVSDLVASWEWVSIWSAGRSAERSGPALWIATLSWQLTLAP